jgi:hypothetical protein
VADPQATAATPPVTDPIPAQAPATQASDQQGSTANELVPNVGDPKELKPNTTADGNALPPPPIQTNELAAGNTTDSATASSSSQNKDELVDLSSSKKKKKGLGKLNPF